MALIVIVAGCTWGAAGPTVAKADGGYVLNSSTSDLLGAHNERMLVVFGAKVEFKKYFLVGMLNQCMTVATEVTGGVRYDLKDAERARTLTIQ
jgi:hypothetical protein